MAKYELGTTEAPAIVAGSGIANAVGIDPQSALSNLVIISAKQKSKKF